MLCLTRRPQEQIVIPTPLGAIRFTILSVGTPYSRNSVRVGIEAPPAINIARGEVFDPVATPEVCESIWGPLDAGPEAA